MAITTEAQFKKELTKINNLLNDLVLMKPVDKSRFLGEISTLTTQSADMNDPTARVPLLARLDALKESLINHYDSVANEYTNLILREYALDDKDILELGRLATEYATAPEDKKFEAFEALLTKIKEAIVKLQTKGIITSDYKVDVGAMSARKEKRFTGSLERADDALVELGKLQEELATVHDPKDVKRVVKKIDGQLRRVNSTNRTLARLRNKVGHIEPHQRSLQVKASQIKAARNQSVIDTLYTPEQLNESITNLRKACEREKNATTATELYRARRDIKRAEREVYGRRLTKRRAAKIDEAVAKRNMIIRDAQSVEYDNERTYRREFNKTMKKLEKIDRKIIGRRNADELYWKRSGLRRKSGYLVGGTSLTLPKQVVELDQTIHSVRR